MFVLKHSQDLDNVKYQDVTIHNSEWNLDFVNLSRCSAGPRPAKYQPIR